MGKSRMMGAGNASSTLYKCSPNLPSGGGNKKQGITSRVGLNNWENREVQTQSNGIGRFKFHFMNQLGGVEPGHSMFGGRWNRGDGLSRQFEQKQLEVKIKQDENNGVIIPLEKRFVRSSLLYPRVGCGTVYRVYCDFQEINGKEITVSCRNTVRGFRGDMGLDLSNTQVPSGYNTAPQKHMNYKDIVNLNYGGTYELDYSSDKKYFVLNYDWFKYDPTKQYWDQLLDGFYEWTFIVCDYANCSACNYKYQYYLRFRKTGNTFTTV